MKRTVVTFFSIVIVLFSPLQASAQVSFSSLFDQIKALQEKVLQLQSQLEEKQEKQSTSVAVTAPPAFFFDFDLTVGNSGEAVTKLQGALTDNGVYAGPVTGYFGPLTKAGVAKFQDKYANEILTPVGLIVGTGYFGPSTRKKLNALNVTSVASVVPVASTKEYPIVTTTTTPSDSNILSFNGTDDFVDVGNSPSLALGNNFEISLFAKFTSKEPMVLINRVDGGGTYNQYWYLDTSRGGRIEASLGDGTNYSQIFSNVSVNDGAWHKISWKRVGDTQTLFIDGVDRAEINYIDSGIGNVNPPTNIYIGASIESNDYFFEGEIADVQIIIDNKLQWPTQ